MLGGAMLDTVIDGLLASVRRHTHVDVAYLAQYDGREVTVRSLSGEGAIVGLRVGHRVHADESIVLASLAGTVPSVIADTSAHHHSKRLADAARDGVGAFASIPIHLPDGTLYGALCIVNGDPVPNLAAPTALFLRAIGDVIADQLHQAAVARAGDEQERRQLDALLEHGQMCTLLQPIVGLHDGRAVGVEALTRFTLPPRRPPDLWFSMAARHGLGAQLELAAVVRALDRLPHVPERWYLSVNASPSVVEGGHLAAVLGPDVGPRMVVEVTEHAAVDDYTGLTGALDDLRARGVRIAVDDVGAGFASFRHVLRLRPDLIKIDGSLVRGLDRDPMHRAMVESIVHVAEEAGAGVVAEAVETPSELRMLQDLGVPAGQGYLFAAPCDPEDLRPEYPVRVTTPLDATG